MVYVIKKHNRTVKPEDTAAIQPLVHQIKRTDIVILIKFAVAHFLYFNLRRLVADTLADFSVFIGIKADFQIRVIVKRSLYCFFKSLHICAFIKGGKQRKIIRCAFGVVHIVNINTVLGFCQRKSLGLCIFGHRILLLTTVHLNGFAKSIRATILSNIYNFILYYAASIVNKAIVNQGLFREALIKLFVHIAPSDFLSGWTNKPQ